MKKITENELLQKVSKLKEYIAVVESEQVNEVNWGALGTGALNAVKGAGGAISNALGTTAGKVAAGTALGVGGTLAAQKLAGGQAPAPAGTTAKVPGKSDPAVMKQQQDLIAKGAKIKADGIMGPATQAAIKQFGAAAGGANPAAAPAADPAMTAADQEDADMGAAMRANAAAAANQAGHNAVIASGQPDDSAGFAPPAAAPTATAGAPPPPAAAPAAAPALTPQEKALAQQSGMATTQSQMADLAKKNLAAAQAGQPISATPTKESVNFRNDELSRIVSLVQYR